MHKYRLEVGTKTLNERRMIVQDRVCSKQRTLPAIFKGIHPRLNAELDDSVKTTMILSGDREVSVSM
jgi:hypothetical protein